MPKMKTKSGAKKRFRITANGRLAVQLHFLATAFVVVLRK